VQTGLALADVTACQLFAPPGSRNALAQQGGILAAIEKRLAALETKTQYLSVAGTTTLFTGTNVQIVNGLGATNGTPTDPNNITNPGTVNGLGNLIIGYNENRDGVSRSGSHNLIVGLGNGYPSWGGLVAGAYNQISGPVASVSGGGGNTASVLLSSVSGGENNTASGDYSSVSGGAGNTASHEADSVSGGVGNVASGGEASVSGGASNIASGSESSVSGGAGNTASGGNASVSGGLSRHTASGDYNWAAGSLFQSF
jgi:hypothetical protein